MRSFSKNRCFPARPSSSLVLLIHLGITTALSSAEADLEGKKPSGSSVSKVRGLLERMTIQELLDANVEIELSGVDEVRVMVWEKYKREKREDPVRRQEHESRILSYSGATMRYEYYEIGPKPKNGYPLYIALHGGGGAPARVNDGQWRHMTVYYRQSVKEGVYVAPRGVSNTWNLHFRGESYPLYDRLIENMILYEDVDPNRVYLLGYSAGGDGVYQIVPRMADRWAAANMSAGHHNGVSPKNLYHVAFLLQVGELDRAYNRNQETVKFHLKLEALRKNNPDGYVHELFVHYNRPHNFLDNHPRESKQEVIADPAAWLEKRERRRVSRNTNAVAWLRKHRRDPLPPRLVWDLKTRADRRDVERNGKPLWGVANRGQQRYWLDIGTHDAKSLGVDEIVARVDRDANAVTVEKPAPYLRLLLSGRMLDLSRPVTIRVGSEAFEGRARPNLKTMLRTTLERGDPNFTFEAEVVLQQKKGRWGLSGF